LSGLAVCLLLLLLLLLLLRNDDYAMRFMIPDYYC